MKTICTNALVISLALLAPLLAAGAKEGTGVKGGHPLAQKFVAAGREAQASLSAAHAAISIDSIALGQAIETTSVEITDEELKLGGLPKVCLNYSSQKRVRCNGKGLEQVSDRALPAFALHEYLGILDIEDANYQLSYKLTGMKMEKLTCVLTYEGAGKGMLKAEPSESYDGGLSRNPEFLKIENIRNFDSSLLKFTWNLAIRDENWVWDGSRPTKILVRAPTSDEPVQLDVNFDTASGKYADPNRTSMNVGLLFLKGKNRRDGEGMLRVPFPTREISFAVRSPKLKKDASVTCTME